MRMEKKENKYLKQAQEELGYLNGDPAFRRLVEARAGFLRDQHAFEVAGIEKGEKLRNWKRKKRNSKKIIKNGINHWTNYWSYWFIKRRDRTIDIIDTGYFTRKPTTP